MSRPATMEQNLRMECTYIIRGHARRRQAICQGVKLPAGECAKYTAVERALSGVEPCLRKALLYAIGDRVAYERLDVPCGRQTFYRRRNALMLAVAQELSYLEGNR